MITPVAPYNTSFTGKVNILKNSAKKTARKVVKTEVENLKGIAKTPVRFANKNNDLGDDFWAASSYVAVTALATSLWS